MEVDLAIPVHNEENRAILEKYWSEDYQYRSVISPESMRWELESTLDLVGHHSLVSISAKDLQLHINQLEISNNKQRRVVDRLNMLLKFMGRDLKLKKKKKDDRVVTYLNENQFQAIVPHIKNEITRLAARIAFETGLRLGEIFGLRPENYTESQLNVTRQLTRAMTYRKPKNGKARRAFCFDAAEELLAEWFAIPEAQRNEHRNENSSEAIKDACKLAFPSNQDQWIPFHALRHSYAIRLISKGISISLVAQSLGNSVSVCQEYYGGFSLTTESVQSIKLMLGSQKG
ncbi:MAG: hypothetical protein EOP04_21690 [Proteobacteria bacterium]|nr:MAG: hypothetical protein EOP04_21690 [Pseudomonadota bacterium]